MPDCHEIHEGGFVRICRRHDAGDSAFSKDHDAIAERHQFRQFRRDDDDRRGARGHFAEKLVNLRLGADIDAPGRLIDNQDLGVQRHAARH